MMATASAVEQSTLDLLEFDVDDDGAVEHATYRYGGVRDEPAGEPEHTQHFVVKGAATGSTVAISTSRKQAKCRPSSASIGKTHVRSSSNQISERDKVRHRKAEEVESAMANTWSRMFLRTCEYLSVYERSNGFCVDVARLQAHLHETEQLRDELERCRRELEHAQEEKTEIETAFRRLDLEVGNGYNLVERKEKEMRIAELLTKNKKMAQMLERELQTQETLRTENTELNSQVMRQQEQITLLNHALRNVETKHSALLEANNQLTISHASAQSRVVALQEQVHELQGRIEGGSSAVERQYQQHLAEYEDKIRVWESQAASLRRNFDEKTKEVQAEQFRVRNLQLELERYAANKHSLETEIGDAHDQMIKMSGAMKAMEVTIEATMPGPHAANATEKMNQRVRALEGELLTKNRQVSDLMQTVDELLGRESSSVPMKRSISSRRGSGGVHMDNNAPTVRVRALQKKITALSLKLQSTEESRDHKQRCLGILLKAIPNLLQQIDALHDKYEAASESNAILAHAIEQTEPEANEEARPPCSLLTLARENYILSAPYQPQLLMGYTASRAFSDTLDLRSPPKRSIKNFVPFQVATTIRSTSLGETEKVFVLMADPDDKNGESFLNRSKINVFLQFVQGKAAQKKFKSLVVGKLADFLTRQREMLHQSSSDTSFYKACVASLDREVESLKRRLKQYSANEANLMDIDQQSNAEQYSRRLLLFKIVDMLAAPHQQQQSTFLTQPLEALSDSLKMSRSDRGLSSTGLGGELSLDLSGCLINDQDLEQLLLKVSVCGHRFTQLCLDRNKVTDVGAATIAAFLETFPAPLRQISLCSNSRITSHGIKRIKDGLMRNPRIHRVELNTANNVLEAFSAESEIDATGSPSIVLQVLLSDVMEVDAEEVSQDADADPLIQRLQAMGMCEPPKPQNTEEGPRNHSSLSRKVATVRCASSVVPSTSTSNRSRLSVPAQKRHQQRQRELKFRSLEAAIRRADQNADRERHGVPTKKPLGVSHLQYLLKNPYRATTASATTAAMNQRIRKLHFAQSHLATIRGLKG